MGAPHTVWPIDSDPPGASASRVADGIRWSWGSLDPVLRDDSTDPAAVLPYVSGRSRTFYWELHFEEQRQTRTDFLHRVPLAPAASDEPPLCDPVGEALVTWFAGADTARHCHGSAWLEIDGPLAAGAPLRPQGVSICLDPEIGGAAPRDPARLRRPTATVLDIFSRLRWACGCEPLANAVLARVHRAVVAAGGSLRHLSLMRGRARQPGKIYAALPKPALETFLAGVAWPGDTPSALRLAQIACADSRSINLDLEFHESLTPRIGFELFFDPSPARDPLRATAIQLARSLQLLSDAQAAGLARWVGSFERRFGDDASASRLQRWLDLKFVLLPDRIELKAYLGFRWCESMF